jgi:hypothetical protein
MLRSKRSRQAILTAPEIRAVAVEAEVDPRTVRRVLLGEQVVALPRMRILRTLRERGFAHLIPQPAEGGR